jgi:hypothetical protein
MANSSLTKSYEKWAHVGEDEDDSELRERNFLKRAQELAPKDGTPSKVRFDHGEGRNEISIDCRLHCRCRGGRPRPAAPPFSPRVLLSRWRGVLFVVSCALSLLAAAAAAPCGCCSGSAVWPGAFTAVDQQLLSESDISTAMSLPLAKMEVWQVSVLKLRMWCASTTPASSGFPDAPSNAQVTRPYCVFLSNLHPMSRVFSQRVCHPLDEFPSASTILASLLQKMREPTDGTTPRRPSCVVFSAKSLAAECFNSLKAVGIDCSQLCDAPDMASVVKTTTEHMVASDLGVTAGEHGERPGGVGALRSVVSRLWPPVAIYL